MCWHHVLASCVGIMCWRHVLASCVGIMCWHHVLASCVGNPADADMKLLTALSSQIKNTLIKILLRLTHFQTTTATYETTHCDLQMHPRLDLDCRSCRHQTATTSTLAAAYALIPCRSPSARILQGFCKGSARVSAITGLCKGYARVADLINDLKSDSARVLQILQIN